MGTEFWELVCDEHYIGSSGEYCGENDSHLGRINVFNHDAWAASTCPAWCSSTSSPA